MTTHSLMWPRLRSGTVDALRDTLRNVSPRLATRFEMRSWMRGAYDEAAVIRLLATQSRASIDVGAHAGAVTLLLARRTVACLAFEPSPAFGYLSRALPPNCRFYPVALSDQAGHATLRIPHSGRRALRQLASISSTNTLSDFTCSTVEVEVRTLDDVVGDQDIGFIKIDVEGHELAVLKGAQRTLARSRPNLVVEAEERHRPGAIESIAALLQAHGYTGHFIHRGTLVPVESFRPGIHQRATAITTAGKSDDYANCFIFLPRSAAPASPHD